MTSDIDGFPRLVLADEFTELDEYDVMKKGYYGHAAAEFSDGTQVPLYFYDPIRLSQDLAHDVERGEICIGEPGLIVIQSVDRKSMDLAVKTLAHEGFFDSFIRQKPNAK